MAPKKRTSSEAAPEESETPLKVKKEQRAEGPPQGSPAGGSQGSPAGGSQSQCHSPEGGRDQRLRPNCFNYVHQLNLLRIEGGECLPSR
jgi:hypothetical protein